MKLSEKTASELTQISLLISNILACGSDTHEIEMLLLVLNSVRDNLAIYLAKLRRLSLIPVNQQYTVKNK